MSAQPPSWDGTAVRADWAPDRLGDSQTTLGGLHLAGVFNGVSNVTVSHRARIPAVFNHHVRSPGLRSIGAALDLRGGVLRNRTALLLPGICTASLEHRACGHNIDISFYFILVHFSRTVLSFLTTILWAPCSQKMVLGACNAMP